MGADCHGGRTHVYIWELLLVYGTNSTSIPGPLTILKIITAPGMEIPWGLGCVHLVHCVWHGTVQSNQWLRTKYLQGKICFRGADQNTERSRSLFPESRTGYLNAFYPLLTLGFVAVMVFLTPLCSVLPTPTYGKILSRLLYNSVSFFQFTHCPLAPKGL